MSSRTQKLDAKVVKDITNLLWGTDLKDEVFTRWTQGFCFSEDEKTALVQHEGGPCAVIAPIQAYIIREAWFSESPKDDLKTVTEEESKQLLIQALTKVLLDLSSTGRYTVLSIDRDQASSTDNSFQQSTSGEQSDSGETSPKRARLDQESFHKKLRCTECENEESVRNYFKSNLNQYTDSYGVLLYLYSVIVTKGIEQIKNEVEDPGEPLIDGIHGHGSQSLINLFLTGKAVSNVWDNDKDVSGMKLRGISKQATIGFLTILEYLRYCEVGWYLKNPLYPIWLLGSETHLTVLFSKERSLVTGESDKSSARMIFQRFDPEGNGFISTSLLGDLLSELDLVSEKEYVDIMKKKLDSESLGIITMSGFMEEFYPGDVEQEIPKSFTLYHYNGLCRSFPDGKVVYRIGTGTIQEELDVQIITDISPLKNCLQTKWHSIELKWTLDQIPSLN